jgi:NAD(P)-dependent dehydrogenase (short-subunit alcohol dehydrogenase family)
MAFVPNTMATNLSSKVAVVTGGSRGIGLAIAAAFLDNGASVVINGLDEGRLAEARQTLIRGGADAVRLHAIKADLQDPLDAERLVDSAAERFDGVDILVNNAGIGAFAPIADMSLDEWRRVIDTNLSAVFYCTRAAIPHLRRRGGGWIVNVSSLAGKNPFVGGGAYCASKSALNAFSEVLMQEVRHDGIRVSYVLPGSVRTRFSSGGDAAGTEWKLAPDDVAQVVLDLVKHPDRSLPSRVELRPSRPPRK